VLPLLRPSLLYGAGTALLLGLGQFTTPILLGTNEGITVLTTDMYVFSSQFPANYAAAAAVGSPLLLIGLAVPIVQRMMLRRNARFVTHGGKSFQGAARKPSKRAALAIVIYAIISVLLPLAALLIVALSPFWSSHIDVAHFSLQSFRQVFDQTAISSAITTSVVTSLIAIAIAIPIGFAAATMVLRELKPRFIGWIVDFIVSIPLGIPSVIFGFGFLITYSSKPFILYGTDWVIIFVYVTLMLPFTTRMQMAGMISLGTTYAEASRVAGAGWLRTNVYVILPLLRSTIGSAAALMFVLLTNEFAAVLLVTAPTTQVMGTVLYTYWTNGTYPTVAAIAVIMMAVTAICAGAALLIGGSELLEKL
jgi:iron(III) transport system permease protein